MSNLSLVKQANFGDVVCDFYKNESNEILITREQAGEALQYSEPRKSIHKIHERHPDRFEKNSVVVSLAGKDGKMYETYLYNQKGLYEICRWSRQPKADAFIDWAWDVIEQIRTTGSYGTPSKLQAWGEILSKTPDFSKDEILTLAALDGVDIRSNKADLFGYGYLSEQVREFNMTKILWDFISNGNATDCGDFFLLSRQRFSKYLIQFELPVSSIKSNHTIIDDFACIVYKKLFTSQRPLIYKHTFYV